MGLVKAGWHCGGNPAFAETPHDCPECERCVGGFCEELPQGSPCGDDGDACNQDVCQGAGCFVYLTGDMGLSVVIRLKDNIPSLYAAAQKRFANQPPAQVVQRGCDTVELWDAEDFDPWKALRWPSVRILVCRQHKADGSKCEAY